MKRLFWTLFVSVTLVSGSVFARGLDNACTQKIKGNSKNYMKQTQNFISGVEQQAEFEMIRTHGPYMIPIGFVDAYLAALKIRSGIKKINANSTTRLDNDEVEVLSAICENNGHLDFSIF